MYMRAWGPGLYQNGVAEVVRFEFINLLKCGQSNEESTKRLIKSIEKIAFDKEEETVFWLALADTQWKLGRLLPNVKEMALKYILNNLDLKVLEQKWGPKNSLIRKQILVKLGKKLKRPMPSLKKLTSYSYYKCPWKVGDIYAYRLESDYAKQKGFFGRYILIYKIDEYIEEKGEDADIYPIVYLKLTKTTKIPETLYDINSSIYLKNFNFRYRYINYTITKKFVKKLIYIDNFPSMYFPIDEVIIKNVNMPYFNLNWKNIEEQFIISKS